MKRCWTAVCRVIGGLYRFLWEHTFGRPWTYVIREWAHENPLKATALVPLFVAVFIVAQWKFNRLYVIIPCDLLFFLLGHLFWDTVGPYIKKQRDFKAKSP